MKTDKKLEKITKIIIFLIIIFVIIDQLSKMLIIKFGEIIIIQDIFRLSVENPNYSGSIITKIVQYIIVLAVITKLIMNQNKFIETKMKIYLSLVLAGGISNLIDIILRKNIVNFINIKIGNITLPIVNLAYILILIGAILLIANFTVFTSKEMRNKKNEKIQS